MRIAGTAIANMLVAIMLVGCGGGGGGGNSNVNNTPPSQATAQDLANAKSAAMVGSYDTSGHMLTLSWTDAFSAGTGFQIEQQQSDGSWSKIDAVPGASASGSPVTWTRAVNAETIVRVEAVLNGYNVPLQTQSGQQQIDVKTPTTPPALTLGAAQPLSVPTDVSLTGGTYGSVTYLVDSKSIGSTTLGPDYLVTLNPAGFVKGAHQLQAQVAAGTDLIWVVQQQVMLASPELAVDLPGISDSYFNPLPVSGPLSGGLQILPSASSDFGITSISVSVDGTSLGTLTAFNACNLACEENGGKPLNMWAFPFDTSTSTSGQHDIIVQATDGNGKTGEFIQQVTFSNPPVLTLTAPLDGVLANGTLAVTGSATTDKSGTLTTVATFNGTQILSTTTSPFSTNYSLAGIAPGSYTLTVTATDATGSRSIRQATVTVTSSPALVYDPVLRFGVNGRLLAVDGTTFAYVGNDGTVHLHSGTNDTLLQNAASTAANTYGNWFVSGGNTFAGYGSAYMWAPDGTRTNLSAAAQTAGVNDIVTAVHGAVVIINSNGKSATVYNVSTATKATVALPAGTTSIDGGDFFMVGGNVVFYYAAETSAASEVFRWDQASGTSTQVTHNGVFVQQVQTDGTRVAWFSSTGGNGIGDLVSLDIASNTQTTLSHIAVAAALPYLRDGLLAWRESSQASGGVKVSDGTNTTTLSNRLSAVLFGTSSGYVLFEDQGKLNVWNAAGGSKLILDVPPGTAVTSQKTVYFTNGATQALYRVPLQ